MLARMAGMGAQSFTSNTDCQTFAPIDCGVVGISELVRDKDGDMLMKVPVRTCLPVAQLAKPNQ